MQYIKFSDNCYYCDRKPEKFSNNNVRYYITQHGIAHTLLFCCQKHFQRFIIENRFIKCNLALHRFSDHITKHVNNYNNQMVIDNYTTMKSIQDALIYLDGSHTNPKKIKTLKTKHSIDIFDYIRNQHKA